MTKSERVSVSSRFLILLSTFSAQVEEVNVALLDGFLFQDFAGNFLEGRVYLSLGCDLFRGFVEFEGELPAQHIDGEFLRGVCALASGFPHFGGYGVHVGTGYGRVQRAYVYHASGFYAVQPDVAADRWRGTAQG